MIKHGFPEGGIQRERFIELRTDHHDDGPYRCRHARPLKQGEAGYRRPYHLGENDTDDTEDGYQFITPLVVLAWNQGGHDCTVVCVDCILEAREKILNGTRTVASEDSK
jgi:hypothetical protein